MTAPPIGIKSIMLKLGGDCNLNCPHCHCSIPEFEFNPKILDWIGSEPISRINFNGGEPLLYFPTIQRIIEALGDGYDYKFVTNGTLLTTRIIEYCNDHNVNIIVSYDGEKSGRDQTQVPRWELMRFARRCALSVYTSGSTDVAELQEDVDDLVRRFKIRKLWNTGSVMPHFLHETATSPRRLSLADAQNYLVSLSLQVEEQILEYLRSGTLDGKQALVRSVQKWLEPKKAKFGVACCSDRMITLTLDGRFQICPYRSRYCGDIERGIDIDAVERIVPVKCRVCPIFDVCRNTCIENATNHECYIARKMNAHLKTLERKYSIDLLDIVSGVSRH